MVVMEELPSSEIQMGITPYTFTCKLNEGNNEGEVNVELWARVAV
jgi:L-lysine 2,3-aminomutase